MLANPDEVKVLVNLTPEVKAELPVGIHRYILGECELIINITSVGE